MGARPALLATAMLTLAAAGCGGSRQASCLEGAGTGPVQAAASRQTAYLSGVAVAPSGCADRIDLAFEHAPPGYRVEYLPGDRAKIEDGSGRRIAVAGDAFLVVRLAAAATARSDGSTLTFTYHGPRRLGAEGTHHVREVVKTGDFEAVVTWVVGLDERRPFTVSRTRDRLVVQVG